MEECLEYEIKNKTLTIKKCPDNILSNALFVDGVLEDDDIRNVIICEGIERIEYRTFYDCRNLRTISLPSTLKTIEDSAFSRCEKLKEVELPSGLQRLSSDAFSRCINLRKINIPSSVKTIEKDAFYNCTNLTDVNIEEGVMVIEDEAFSCCESLTKIDLPSSIKYLGSEVFSKCTNLKKITIPEGIDELNGCFYMCENLKKVTLPSSLKIITRSCFSDCAKLAKIDLPNNLEIIGDNAFSNTGLWNISIPSSVKVIGEEAFQYCSNLFNVEFNEGLKKIEAEAFSSCYHLTDVNLPNSVETIEQQAFKGCSNLMSLKLSNNLKVINDDLFSLCYKLRKVEIPEGVRTVHFGAFFRCHRLEEIHFPSTLKYFDKREFTSTTKLSKLYVKCNGDDKEIDFIPKKFVYNDLNKLFLYDNQTNRYSFYNDGEYIEFGIDMLLENPKIKRMISEGYVEEKDYINLYYWCNKKIIPSLSVIRAMPVKDVDKFFINKNCNEWAKLVKESNVEKTYEAVASFFKLCYVLGVFSESTGDRDKAVSFIRENIIGKLKGSTIHSKFDGFDLSNGFNKTYADFFMKYYTNSEDFLVAKDDYDEEVDLTCACYNNFKQVKKAYPNKTLNTNRRADLLLPKHVMNAARIIEYEDINEGNEEFALFLGKYGYTQEQFETLQTWYDKAKSIKENELRLFICKDNEEKGITYELLSKSDPRGAILGNITNCCQILDGAGEECVEYGMTRPNSGFLTFNYKDKIIAQAWIWYDEVSKVLCLDNIEVPHRYIEKINDNKDIKESFIACILRVEENFKKEMKKRGLEVQEVTIGKGYNDINNVLKEKFENSEKPNTLHGYSGYSDASNQYKIRNKR